MLACLPGPGDLPLQLLPHTQMNTGLQKCEYWAQNTHTTTVPHNKPSCYDPAAGLRSRPASLLQLHVKARKRNIIVLNAKFEWPTSLIFGWTVASSALKVCLPHERRPVCEPSPHSCVKFDHLGVADRLWLWALSLLPQFNSGSVRAGPVNSMCFDFHNLTADKLEFLQSEGQKQTQQSPAKASGWILLTIIRHFSPRIQFELWFCCFFRSVTVIFCTITFFIYTQKMNHLISDYGSSSGSVWRSACLSVDFTPAWPISASSSSFFSFFVKCSSSSIV